MHNHNPIYCILPPHVLDKIAENGTDSQRDNILKTVTASGRFRGRRRAISEMVASFAAAAPAGTPNKLRTVYDAKNGTTLPGTVVRKEGEPPVADVAVNEAYDGAGVTYDLYSGIYNRNSIDGNGLKLDSTVHYQKNYDNAFWDGSKMVYGDGDGDLFNRFTIAIDVIGHELTHGVTQYSANLVYMGQSGALNESFSDVFGSLVKQYQLKQNAADADWLIGQGLLTAQVKGVALRSMKAPGTAYDDPVLGKDPQPAHMKNYVNTVQDNGGVHINSGIPNHAFYVIATEIGGFAWNKAGLIWYKTLTDKLQQSSDFQAAANLTFQTAGEIFGVGSLEQLAVKTGWAEVGIVVDGGTTPTPNPGCLTQALQALGLERISR